LTDTDVGLSASIHLYARFGVDTPVDLNGRQFVDSAYVGAHTIRVEGGTAYVPERSGLGVDVDEEKVARLRRRMEDD
jgi:muconate cycloisomerase